MRYSDFYKWSINFSLAYPSGIFIRVWVGDVHWTWESKRPLQIVRVDTQAQIKEKVDQVLKNLQK